MFEDLFFEPTVNSIRFIGFLGKIAWIFVDEARKVFLIIISTKTFTDMIYDCYLLILP